MLMHSEALKTSLHFCCITRGTKRTNPNNVHAYALHSSGEVGWILVLSAAWSDANAH